jgi:hypothetical protein
MLGGFPVLKSTTLRGFQSDDTETLAFIASVSFRTGIGTQPASDVRRLRRLLYRVRQVVPQGVEVCLVSELGREIFERLRGVVLTKAETPIYERLDETTEGLNGAAMTSVETTTASCGCSSWPVSARKVVSRSRLQRRRSRLRPGRPSAGSVDQRAVGDDVYVLTRARELRMNPEN